MPTYRYIFGSTYTQEATAEIPLYGVYITDKLNDVGYMQGSFQLDQTGIDNDDLVSSTIPGFSWVAVMRNDSVDPVWAGFITSRTYQAQSKSIQFYAKTLEGHLANRLIITGPQEPYPGTFQRINVDQGQILWDLFQRIGLVPPAVIDIYDSGGNNVLPGPVTGVLKTVDLRFSDFKTYRDVVDELANSDNGFDWRFIPHFNLSSSEVLQFDTVTVAFGYPNLGITNSPSSMVFEFPGNILNYYRTDNLSGASNNLYGLGAGQGDSMLFSRVNNYNQFVSQGFELDATLPLKSITDQAILNSRTAQEAVKRLPPRAQYKVTLKSDQDPQFGYWSLGDTVRLIIKDAMHPLGLDMSARISAYALTPASADSAEEVSIEFVGDFE